MTKKKTKKKLRILLRIYINKAPDSRTCGDKRSRIKAIEHSSRPSDFDTVVPLNRLGLRLRDSSQDPKIEPPYRTPTRVAPLWGLKKKKIHRLTYSLYGSVF